MSHGATAIHSAITVPQAGAGQAKHCECSDGGVVSGGLRTSFASPAPASGTAGFDGTGQPAVELRVIRRARPVQKEG